MIQCFGSGSENLYKRKLVMALNIVENIDDAVKVKNVLLSVSDKSGLDDLVPALVAVNPEINIYSTGGTYAAIEKILGDVAEKNLIKVSDYTGQPEMQGGLVKTLDFKIYLGLLSETYNQAHQDDLKRVNGIAIDMVVVNLYPFKETVAKDDVTSEMARTNIDIGGPCMIRASAKNFLRVSSVTDPADYAGIIEELNGHNGCISLEKRFELSRKAFAHTAEYDTAIAGYFAGITAEQVKGVYKCLN
jgi:phosphoribosylaminoimidazolecarboxamide formyltransferase/IMP cyclohydrolase